MQQTLRSRMKELGAAVLLGFTVGCAVVAFTDRGAADAASAFTIVVNHTNKGDRRPLVLPPGRPLSTVSPRTTLSKRIPLACDPAFGPGPAAAHAPPACRS